MAEDHSTHHDLEDEDGFTPQELAVMRWKAIQGFNGAPGISPLAARLGIALICHMDAKKRICFVGELRLSIELGVHILSIQKAKKQLKMAGLIHWSNPGGPRHLSHYSFDWAILLGYSRQTDEAARVAIERARSDRRNHNRKAAMDMPSKNSRRAVIKPFANSTYSKPIPANSQAHPSQLEPHPSQRGASITAAGLADITIDIFHKDIAPDHAIASNGGRATIPHLELVSTPHKEATIPANFPTPTGFRELEDAFGDEPQLLGLFNGLRPDAKQFVMRTLLHNGAVKARTIILERAARLSRSQ